MSSSSYISSVAFFTNFLVPSSFFLLRFHPFVPEPSRLFTFPLVSLFPVLPVPHVPVIPVPTVSQRSPKFHSCGFILSFPRFLVSLTSSALSVHCMTELTSSFFSSFLSIILQCSLVPLFPFALLSVLWFPMLARGFFVPSALVQKVSVKYVQLFVI